MEKRYIKKTLRELHTHASVYKCRKCKEHNTYIGLNTYGGGDWDAAVECGNCSAIIAFNMREIPELRELISSKPMEGVETEEDARNRLPNLLHKFYDSMPPCPRCNHKRFRLFRVKGEYPMEPFTCDKCGADLLKHPKSIGISKQEYSLIEGWWYEVVKGGKENSDTQVEHS